MTRFVMSFSGGMCSWFAAQRLVERHGAKSVTLLFADTLIEHSDLYRFLIDASNAIGVPVTRIADGRTPWDIFFENRMMGNSRVDLCSRILKRELLDRWCRDNCDPAKTIICAGLSVGERARYIRFRARMRARGWRVQAPAMAAPYTDKAGMLAAMQARGLEPSDSYEDGFAHDNCGGFCVKQGHRGFINLLTKRPAVFAFHENKEQQFIQLVGKPVAILRDRTGGKVTPLTLRALRERVEARQLDRLDFADEGQTCGCAIDS